MVNEPQESNDYAYIDKHCIGCHYYAGIADSIYYCSYFIKEDKCRPCPPGKDCTVRIDRADYKTKEKKLMEKKPNERQPRIQKNEIWCTYKGEKKTLAEWAKIVGINRATLYNRIKIQGWSVDRALETPKNQHGKRK